jgi:hypothetical protein
MKDGTVTWSTVLSRRIDSAVTSGSGITYFTFRRIFFLFKFNIIQSLTVLSHDWQCCHIASTVLSHQAQASLFSHLGVFFKFDIIQAHISHRSGVLLEGLDFLSVFNSGDNHRNNSKGSNFGWHTSCGPLNARSPTIDQPTPFLETRGKFECKICVENRFICLNFLSLDFRFKCSFQEKDKSVVLGTILRTAAWIVKGMDEPPEITSRCAWKNLEKPSFNFETFWWTAWMYVALCLK